jgi:hypothetical protein
MINSIKTCLSFLLFYVFVDVPIKKYQLVRYLRPMKIVLFLIEMKKKKFSIGNYFYNEYNLVIHNCLRNFLEKKSTFMY